MAFSVFEQRQQAKHFQLEESPFSLHARLYRHISVSQGAPGSDCDVTDHQMGVLVCIEVSATEMISFVFCTFYLITYVPTD